MYLFRSFRKPKLEHHYKIIEETIELRKLMGWTGHGGITNGMLNPSGMVSHYRRFDSLSDIDNLIPWEREVYVKLLTEAIETEEKEANG